MAGSELLSRSVLARAKYEKPPLSWDSGGVFGYLHCPHTRLNRASTVPVLSQAGRRHPQGLSFIQTVKPYAARKTRQAPGGHHPRGTRMRHWASRRILYTGREAGLSVYLSLSHQDHSCPADFG